MVGREWISVHRDLSKGRAAAVQWIARWADGMASGVGNTPEAALEAFCRLAGETVADFEIAVHPSAPADVRFFKRRRVAA